MPAPRQPGRRRAPGRVKRLPDGLSRHGVAWAAKSLAGLGVVGGAALALSLPLEASADATTAARASASAPATALANRAPAQQASRSLVRDVTAAVTAPAGRAPSRPTVAGLTGVTAVAKPKASRPASARPSPDAASPSPTPADAYTGGVSAKCASLGLLPNAQRLCTAIQANFGLSNIGGYRAGDGEHGTGQAVDFMISGQAQGDAIAAWVQQHVGQFNVEYVIWRQRYWEPGGAWRLMPDRGSPTANHYDHVHVTVAS